MLCICFEILVLCLFGRSPSGTIKLPLKCCEYPHAGLSMSHGLPTEDLLGIRNGYPHCSETEFTHQDSENSGQWTPRGMENGYCILKRIWREKVYILFQVWSKFVLNDPIDKTLSCVYMMAWLRANSKTLYEPMLIKFRKAKERHPLCYLLGSIIDPQTQNGVACT